MMKVPFSVFAPNIIDVFKRRHVSKYKSYTPLNVSQNIIIKQMSFKKKSVTKIQTPKHTIF